MNLRWFHFSARTWRRVAQFGCLLAFLWLFRKTESDGTSDIAFGANLLFRLDPLVAASAVLAGANFIVSLWPALVVVGLTLLVGRFFCGWVCPLGTLLDGFHRLLPHRAALPNPRLRVVKYFLLVVVLVSAVLGFQLVGYLDPFSILVRGLAVAADPWLNRAVTAPFAWLYHHAPAAVTAVTEPIYGFLKNHLLPFQQNTFAFSVVSFAILAAVFVLEWVERRFWCRNLCPAGALMGLLARLAPMRRFPARVCGNCKAPGDCAEGCRMGAFDGQSRLLQESCNLCMDCIEHCPIELPKFSFSEPKVAVAPLEPSRRLFLASMVTGLALPLAGHSAGCGLPPELVRPPGALPEEDFLNLCVRCGECMKVCTTNALQPTFLEAGVGGAFSPRLIGSIGYCEYNCTLCGQVCPTGAIPRLPLAAKQRFVMAMAIFDKELCLPFAKNESCITCEEHCPLPEKAIQFHDVEAVHPATKQRVMVKRPYVIWDLCIGCGICETKCPIEGKRGVRLMRIEAVPATVKNDREIMGFSAGRGGAGGAANS